MLHVTDVMPFADIWVCKTVTYNVACTKMAQHSSLLIKLLTFSGSPLVVSSNFYLLNSMANAYRRPVIGVFMLVFS